ncbi:MAG: phenylalanine--tRNA ligase subunit beta [Gammaproteobacteria bacterium]|nr:phenylalanine--tRNA ligase subunit beta [Gammaproteobacteria bacterium]PCH64435.1 MAG: phenylalanine--tRNA ligase subunit beta [Gammaproteobacteria bacterium]
MLVSENWLRELISPDLDTQGLAHQMTMAGLEVEAIEDLSPEFSKIVVGLVESTDAHPNADKLKLTKVNIGSETLDIVCGASNVAAGVKVPVALVGAKLANGMKIKKAKVRGEVSLGMLCAKAELGLSEESEGLMLLADDAEIGQDFAEYLQLNDHVIDVSLTPNRGDCLSVLGLARDIAVLNNAALTPPPSKTVYALIEDTIDVKLNAGDACSRYCGRVVRDVDMAQATPIWMAERLRRAGVRSLNLVVDITNYVMLELGQPMHAFDLDKLDGGIQVRLAEQGEKITLLNNEEVELSEGTMVIADDTKPHAIAGIMGGLDSSVQSTTKNIFFESAFFHPDAIAGRARQYALHTDSSHRFERGVDFDLSRQALERATSLLLEITEAKPGPINEVVNEGDLPLREPITLRLARIERLLGVTLAAAEIVEILSLLAMKVTIEHDSEWCVTPPSYRFDIEIEADLIEEIARIHGYHHIEPAVMLGALSIRPQTETKIGKKQLCQRLVDRGYQEAISYSFIAPDVQSLFSPDISPIVLANPISTDMAVMRTSIWPGLIQAASRNLARQQDRVRLFETGACYFKDADGRREEQFVAGIIAGNTLAQQWACKTSLHDFYDVKSDIEALLGGLRVSFVADGHPALHPGQSAKIVGGDDAVVGWVGVIHPQLQQQLDIKAVTLFELKLDFALSQSIASFTPLSRFPSNRRDIAVIVDQNVSASALVACVQNSAGEMLKQVDIFDIYKGEAIDLGRKSVAMGLTLQDFSRTLTDADIESVVAEVVSALKNQYSASLRD